MAKVIWRTGKILIVVLMALAVIFIVGLSVWTKAQTFENNYTEDPNDPSDSLQDTKPELRYEVLNRRGRNRRVWEVIREVENIDPVTQTVEIDEQASRIIEVGTGICYQDDQDQWQVTDTSWYITDNGFAMDRAGYELEIGFTIGSWLNYTVDGELMNLRPDAIIAFDGSNMEIIAEVDGNVVGQIDPDDPSRLFFPDAFGDGINLELEAMPAGFHQNVIFNNKPELKGDFDIDKTRIHVFTELNLDEYSRDGMMDVAAGKKVRFGTAQITDTDPTLEDITFIKMFAENDELFEYNLHRFAASEVFDSGKGQSRNKITAEKSLVTDNNGRQFLVETLDRGFFDAASYPITWDYVTINGTWDPDDSIWYADGTYYVSADLEVDEGELRIEPGTVVKVKKDTPAITIKTSGTGKIIARGKPHLRIIFSTENDDNNGEIFSWSTGTRAPGDWGGLEIGTGSEIEHCKILNGETGLKIYGNPGIPVRHSQFVGSSVANIEVTSDPNASVTIFNNIINACNDTTNYDSAGVRISGSGGAVDVVNNTFENTDRGVDVDGSCTRIVTVENNIFANCPAVSIYMSPVDPNYLVNNYNAYYNNDAGVAAGPNSITLTETPFHTADTNLGTRFLGTSANGGGLLIDAGSCSVQVAGYDDPNDMWMPLYPNNLYTSTATISTDTTWEPDYGACDYGVVDIGYHHPRIDYLIHEANVTVSGATLTINPGTIIAHAVNTSTGAGKLQIASDAKLICKGEPFGGGYIRWFEEGRATQKAFIYLEPLSSWAYFVECLGECEVTFSEFVGVGSALVVNQGTAIVRDNIFRLNGRGVDYLSCTDYVCSNSLFVGNNMGVRNDLGSGAVIGNCTFDGNRYGIVTLTNGTIEVSNCLFTGNVKDGGVGHGISYRSSSATLTESYNAFWGNNYNIYSNVTSEEISINTAGGDIALTADPFDTEWADFADRFSLDQTGDSVDNGYDPGALGMRGYTAFLDNSVDDPNMDIGYHYPLGLDSDGDQLWDYEEHWILSNPDMVDTDGDGLTDYDEVMVYGTSPILADTDGDGMPDGWEVLYTNTDALTADATGDLENSGAGDGISNLDEYRYGLDPDVDNEGDYFTYNEYDSAGQVVLTRNIEVEDGEVFATETNTEYDVLGRVKEQRQRAYPGVGPDAGVSHSEDMVVVKSYDVAGNLKKTALRMTSESDPNVIDPDDIVTENFYDKLGRLVTVTDALDLDTTYTYYAGGKLESVTDPGGAVTTNYYDDSGRLDMVVSALGDYRTMDYDSFGRVVRQVSFEENGVTDIALMQNRTVYDDAGRVVMQAVLADADSLSSYIVDPNTDKVTEFVYDDSSGTYPGMLVSQSIYFGYDSSSQTSTIATTTFDYDYLGRRVKTTDPDGNETIVSYDSGGRVYRRQQADYHPTTSAKDVVVTTDFEFDDAGRMIKQTSKPSTDPNFSSDWQVSEFVYALGYRIEETKPNGIISTHEYDSFGKKTKTIADAAVGGLQQTTEWGFDRLGRQTSIAGYTGTGTGGTKQTTTYEYNNLAAVTKITYPDTKTIEYVINDQGKVKKRTDQRNKVTYYRYDKMRNLLLKNTDPNAVGVYAEEAFTYDGLGRMLTAYKTIDSNDVSLTEFAYTDLGQVSDFDQTHFGGTQRQIDYTYDQFGFVESTDYPDGTTTIDRTNDWRGRIDTLKRFGIELVDYDYMGARVAKRSYDVPGVDYDATYDNLGRIKSADYGTAIAKFDYTYVANENNIYRKTFDHRAGDPYNEYTYDDLDRLTDADYLVDSGTADHEESFVMDTLGNRTGNQTLTQGTVNFTVQSSTNRYTSIGGNTITHDDAGNLTVDKDGYQYTYDYENRVVRIKDSSNNDVAVYAYDALGRRIRMVDSVASETTLYYYNPDWQVLAEYDGANNQQRYFVYGNYIDEPLVMHRESDSEDYYFGHDHLFSTVVLIGDGGSVVERYEYDAYATVAIMDASYNSRTASSYGNPYCFTSRRMDVLDSGSLKRQHSRHRDYDAYMARFIQHDPLGYVDGLNLYGYVISKPTVNIDAMGQRIVRLILAYEYINHNTRKYVPSLSDIESVIINILDKKCFEGKLKCDKVRIRCKVQKGKPILEGIVNGGGGKPIMYLQHILLSDKQGSFTNLAYTDGTDTTIFAKRIDNVILKKEPSERSKRRQNLHVIFANITLHEAIWLGLLGKSDKLLAEPGTLPSGAANYLPMELTESECKKIRKALKVK